MAGDGTGAGTQELAPRDAELAQQRARRPRRELARPRDQAVAAPLPAPVELGLGLHRDRLLARRPGAGGAGAAVALRGAVAQRPAAAHRLHRGRALLPGPGVLADGALAGRAAEPADVRDRAAARPRDRGAAGVRPRTTGSARRRSCRAAAEARRVARLPLPRARPGGDGLVEIWHPWESGMDNSPLWDSALDRIELTPADVPEYQRVDVSSRPGGAPDERRVRPLRVPRQALPRPRVRQRRDPRRARSRSSRPLQLAARPVEPRPRRDRARGRRGPRAVRELGGADGRRVDAQLWDADAGTTSTATCGRRADPRAHRRGLRAAPRRDPRRRARRGGARRAARRPA